MPRPAASAPGSGGAAEAIDAVMTMPSSRHAPRATTIAPASGARRPIAPARSNSRRPASSSARVARMTPRAAIIAAAAATKVPTRHIVKLPGCSRSNGGPSIARIVGLAASATRVPRPASVSGMSW